MTTETEKDPEALPPGFKPVTSSNIKAVAWLGEEGQDLYADEHAQQATLAVLFKNGVRWHYADVPRATAHSLLTAESVGSFFNTEIKGNPEHPGEKIEPEPDAQ